MADARRWAVLLMAISGFAALGYQIVWIQQNAQWLGHEAPAMLAIVAAFFGGIGLGALLLGGRIETSARPATWYAGCEAVIGVWALALVFLMGPVSRALLGLIGPQPGVAWHWFIAFAGTFVLLLPATMAMGATFPAMERMLTSSAVIRQPVARLYAANTFGAVLGVIAAAFFLVPRFGLRAAALTCVVANLACALTARQVFGTRGTPTLTSPSLSSKNGARGLLATLAITGLLGIGYEVLVVRVLSQLTENTVFTFAILLAVYLVGTALGAALYARGDWKPEAAGLRANLLRWQALTCVLGIATLVFAEKLKGLLLPWLGGSMGAALAIEFLQACAAFLLPTLVMGALFSHLAGTARAEGTSLGVALGVNTLGAALAPLICGVLLLPWLGSTVALLLIVVGYLLLVMPRAWLSWPQVALTAAAAAFAFWQPPLAQVALPPGGRLVSHVEGVAATVSVVEDAAGIATLHINNRQQEGSSATLYADARQAFIPLLLHPAPRRALFLGLGTGATARAAALDPELRVDAVELLPEVIEASDTFKRLQDAESAAQPRMWLADARRFVRAADEHYDLIVSDNFHPARSGSASLYTEEHFAAVRERLAPGGLFCQWLPLHQLDLETLRSIVHTFTRVYPRSWAVLATNSIETPVIGLIARRDGELFDRLSLEKRLASPGLAVVLPALGLDDELALMGTFVAGPRALQAFAGSAPLNTDDRPVVAYLAPRITYAPTDAPLDRLLEFAAAVDLDVNELLPAGQDAAWPRRLAAYWQARDRYLEIGRGVAPSRDVRQMLAQVGAPLLSVLEISADFRPAYDPLLRMARELGRVDAPQAQALLARLAQIEESRKTDRR